MDVSKSTGKHNFTVYELGLLLLLAAAVCSVLRPSIHGHDGVMNYAYLRSILFDRDLNFANEYEHYMSQSPVWFDGQSVQKDPVTGRPINLYGVGSALLWTPWVLAFHWAGKAINALGGKLVLDGYSGLYENAVGLGSCVYASLGLWLVFLTLRRYHGREAGFWGVLLVWLASPLFFYMYLHPSMSHANSFFLAAALLALYLGGDGLRRWALMGCVAGMLILTRFQDGALLAGLAAGELFRLPEIRRDVRGRMARYGLFCACAAVCLLPQMAVWRVLQGGFLSGPRAYLMQGTVDLWSPSHVSQVLFSARHGLLYWHPALLIAIVGLFLGPKLWRERLVCIAAFAGALWVIGSWSIWWAGASFGHRMFISSLPFLAFGAAAAARRFAGKVWIPAACVIVFAAWNFGYLVQYASGMISRNSAVPIATLARNNVIEVPRVLLRIVSGRPAQE
jgi:hypothetical protein